MRISTTGKAWFGFILAKMGMAFLEERKAAREAAERFHGYRWEQARDVFRMVERHRPAYVRWLGQMSQADYTREWGRALTMAPEEFRATFGFTRPDPW